MLWLVVSHLTAVAGTLALPVDGLGRLVGLGGVAAHAVWRRPRRIGRLVAAPGGLWAMPDCGATGLRVSPASRLGASWIELRLEGSDGCRIVLLCRDQVSATAWRQLKARIRLDLATAHLS